MTTMINNRRIIIIFLTWLLTRHAYVIAPSDCMWCYFLYLGFRSSQTAQLTLWQEKCKFLPRRVANSRALENRKCKTRSLTGPKAVNLIDFTSSRRIVLHFCPLISTSSCKITTENKHHHTIISSFIAQSRPCICNISCGLLRRGISRVNESHHRQVAASYECCRPRHQQHTEVRERLVSSAARRSAVARRRRPGPLQVGSTGISITTWLRSTVPDKPPHVGMRSLVVSTCDLLLNRN